MDTDVIDAPPVTNDGSDVLTYTPDKAGTVWTTYDFPFGLTVGGGVRYGGEMKRGTDGAPGTPEFVKSRSEEHTSELQSLMRISYAVFCLKKKKRKTNKTHQIKRGIKKSRSK